MKDFYKLLLKRGMQLFFIVFLIWLAFWVFNFFSPQTLTQTTDLTYNQNNNVASWYGGSKTKSTFSQKIYNLLFKNFLDPISSQKIRIGVGRENNSTSTNKSYIWGSNASSVALDKNHLNINTTYVSMNNLENPIAKDFKLDDILVKNNNSNLLQKDSIITGKISTKYLSTPYFNIDVYDKNGDYLYYIPASGNLDFKDNSYLNIYAKNSKNYSYQNYEGDGFLVIWSDNPDGADRPLLGIIKIIN